MTGDLPWGKYQHLELIAGTCAEEVHPAVSLPLYLGAMSACSIDLLYFVGANSAYSINLLVIINNNSWIFFLNALGKIPTPIA